MRVAFAGMDSSPGARYTSWFPQLGNELSKRGWEVVGYAVNPQPWHAHVDHPMVSMLGAGGGTTDDKDVAAHLGEFARFLVSEWTVDRPDLAHADGWMSGVAVQLAADKLGIPTVQSLPELSSVARRRTGRELGPPARVRFERMLVHGATHALVSCTDDVMELGRMGAPRRRVSVLPHGVDCETFTSFGPTAERRDGLRRIVAMCSDLLPHRGFDVLVGALSRLRDTELIIVGGSSREEFDTDADVARLREVAERHDVVEHVHFTGSVPVERVPPLLRSADVLACPSWYEPFSIPVLQAMACGVPVVASDAGAMSDLVVQEVTGLLVPPRNPRALSAALGDVLNGGPLHRGMGMAGRTRAQACYSWQRIAQEAETCYERVLSTDAPRREPSFAPASLGRPHRDTANDGGARHEGSDLARKARRSGGHRARPEASRAD